MNLTIPRKIPHYCLVSSDSHIFCVFFFFCFSFFFRLVSFKQRQTRVSSKTRHPPSPGRTPQVPQERAARSVDLAAGTGACAEDHCTLEPRPFFIPSYVCFVCMWLFCVCVCIGCVFFCFFFGGGYLKKNTFAISENGQPSTFIFLLLLGSFLQGHTIRVACAPIFKEALSHPLRSLR